MLLFLPPSLAERDPCWKARRFGLCRSDWEADALPMTVHVWLLTPLLVHRSEVVKVETSIKHFSFFISRDILFNKP